MSPLNQRILGMALVGIIKGVALTVMVANTVVYLAKKNFDSLTMAVHRRKNTFHL